MESQSLLLWSKFPMRLKPPATMAASYSPVLVPRRNSKTSASAASAVLVSKLKTTKSIPLPSTQSLVLVTPPIQGMKNLGFRPPPELGLLSLLFPLSMVLSLITFVYYFFQLEAYFGSEIEIHFFITKFLT